MSFTPDDDRAMRLYYDERAAEYDQWYLQQGLYALLADREPWNAELAAMAERVDAFGSGRILEIAPGTGWWTRHLARCGRVVGLDWSPRMLEVVRKRLMASALQAAFARGDAYALPFKDATFDSCFFGFWLSHVPHARLAEFLGEVRRVLKPKASVMVVDNAASGWEAAGFREPPEPGREYFHNRPLNDGSHHQVLKIFHSPESISAALAPLGQVIEAATTGRYIVFAVVRRGWSAAGSQSGREFQPPL